MYVVDLPSIIKLISDLGLQDNFIPTRMNGTRGKESDWVIFRMPYDPESFIIESKMLNPADGNLNRFDGYSFKVLVDGKYYEYQLNNVQGVVFENSAVLTYDDKGNVSVDTSEMSTTVTVEYTSYNIGLSSKLLGSSISTEDLYGLKFNLNDLINTDAKVNFEIYYNGEKITADADGWYVLTDTSSSANKAFNIVVKVPHDQFADGVDADAFTAQLNDYLSNAGSVLPIQDATAVLSKSSFALADNTTDDVIFNLLSDDNTGGNTETTDDHFVVGSTQTINVSALLSDDATETNIAEYVSVNYDANAQTATISIDRDGAGQAYQNADLLILTNQSSNVTLEQLLQNNQIIV